MVLPLPLFEIGLADGSAHFVKNVSKVVSHAVHSTTKVKLIGRDSFVCHTCDSESHHPPS